MYALTNAALSAYVDMVTWATGATCCNSTTRSTALPALRRHRALMVARALLTADWKGLALPGLPDVQAVPALPRHARAAGPADRPRLGTTSRLWRRIEGITSYGGAGPTSCRASPTADPAAARRAALLRARPGVAAYIPPGRQWQGRGSGLQPSVMALMNKLQLKTHPPTSRSISADFWAAPRAWNRARGQCSRRRGFPEHAFTVRPQHLQR